MNNLFHPPQATRGSVYIKTFGCQMNNYDSEIMAGVLVAAGYGLTDDPAVANVILLNTCGIRDKAEQKVYSQVGRYRPYKDKNQNLIIGVGGCVGQLVGEEILKKAPLADLVFGTSNIDKLPQFLEYIDYSGERIARIDKAEEWTDKDIPIARNTTTSGWVSIMRGCNNFCAYCVVPYARGRERSRAHRDIIKEIEELARSGHREVTLLGQNVNSYGKDKESEISFPQLLKLVNQIEGIERIRFVTSHPKDFSPELVEAMKLEKVCETIHLPLQSGSDHILKRMNRGYTAAQYEAKVAMARREIPGLTITTDIIVGFPGETEEDFAQTREMVKRIGYDTMFLFKYSIRPGTAAKKLDNHIAEDVKQKRLEEILALQNEITLAKNRAYEGKAVEVMVEGASQDKKDIMIGKTRGHKTVLFPADERIKKGSLIEVKITKGRLYGLDGKIL